MFASTYLFVRKQQREIEQLVNSQIARKCTTWDLRAIPLHGALTFTSPKNIFTESEIFHFPLAFYEESSVWRGVDDN